MLTQKEIIYELLKATVTINDTLKSRDLDTLEAMIQKRDQLIDIYRESNISMKDEESENQIVELLELDKKNNLLLESMINKDKVKISRMNEEKTVMKKKTMVAKKYVTGGTSISDSSKFNKKT